MTNRPRVSVLMPMRDAGSYLRAAMDSILAQSFGDFEFIIVDDGSVDGSSNVVMSYADERIRLFESPDPGLTAALNYGLRQCRGALIARMDADDIACPDRLAAQAAFLETHSNADILCSNAHLIDENGETRGLHRMGPLDPRSLRLALSYRTAFKPIVHPSVMMRSAVPEALGGYRDFLCAEDFDFWVRASARFRFAALRKPLMAYRQHSGGVSQKRRLEQATSGVMCVATHHVLHATGIDIFERNRVLFDKFAAQARRRIEREILPADELFRAARRAAAGRSSVLVAGALALAVLRYGPSILPPRRRMRLADLADALAREIKAELRTGSANAMTRLPPAAA